MAVGRGEYLIDIKLLDTGVEARINGVVVSLSDVDKQIKNIRTSSSGASSGLNKISTAAKGTTKANQDLISSSGLAGATLVETGRFISDLPFGITAVTNNLSQLSTLFITLASKTEESGGAFKALGKQIMGPLGFVLIFQIVISLVQAYQKEILGFIKGTKGANEATKEFTKSVDDLNKKLNENNDSFKEANDVENKLITIREQLRLQSEGTRQERARAGKNILGQVEALKKLGKEIDITRLKEEGYIDTLIKENKSSKDISQELEDRRIQLSVDRILGRTGPIELAQRELDLFIATQKELNVKIEDYVKSEEFRTLVAKRDKAIIDARQVDPSDVTVEADGVVEQQITGEVLLTKATEEGTNARIRLGRKETNQLIREINARAKIQMSYVNTLSSFAGLLDQLGEQSKATMVASIIAQKAAGIGSIIINTAAANAKAVALFPVTKGEPFVTLNKVSAALGIAASVLAARNAIKGIKSGQASSASLPGGGGGAAPAIQAPDFNVVGATAQSQLAETVAGTQSRPLRAFVVGKDITTQQELDRNTRRTASFGG